MQDDFRFRGRYRPWPKAMQRTERFFTIILGFTLLTTGAAMLVLPGPVLLTIGLGLVVLAAWFIWARRLPNWLRELSIKLGRSVSGETSPNEPSASC